jgi:hypothetical protein
VGRGLEATLTDALSKTIIDTSILPRFRTGDFAAGIKSGAEGIARALGGGAASPAVAVTPSVPLPVAAAESASAKSAWDEVLNQYRRRTDFIPNLIETVKGYVPRENTILDELAAARVSAIASQSRGDIFTDGSALAAFQVAQDRVSNVLEKLFAAAKNYSDLTSNQGFSALQSQLEATDNRIAIARADYIMAARQPAVPETAKLEQPAPAPAPDATPAGTAPAAQPKPTEQAARLHHRSSLRTWPRSRRRRQNQSWFRQNKFRRSPQTRAGVWPSSSVTMRMRICRPCAKP